MPVGKAGPDLSLVMGEGLSGDMVLALVFETLVFNQSLRSEPSSRGRSFDFTNPRLGRRVVDHRDLYQQHREGIFESSSVLVARFGQNWYLVTLGVSWGYQVHPYRADICVVRYLAPDFEDTEVAIVDEARRLLSQSQGLRDSIIYALSDGNLGGVKESPLAIKLHEKIAGDLDRFVVRSQRQIISAEMPFLSGDDPTVFNICRWKGEIVDFLAEAIKEVLAANQ